GAGMTASTAEHNFAMHKLFLGDTDRNLVKSDTAWQTYGYNLDGKISTKDSTDVCTPQMGGSSKVHNNGPGGVANSFGQNIVAIITNLVSNATQQINDAVNKGSFTVMFDTIGLDDSMATQTNIGVTGELLAGGTFMKGGMAAMPTWSMADDWPIRPE